MLFYCILYHIIKNAGLIVINSSEDAGLVVKLFSPISAWQVWVLESLQMLHRMRYGCYCWFCIIKVW
jgi:hypothetical protein